MQEQPQEQLVNSKHRQIVTRLVRCRDFQLRGFVRRRGNQPEEAHYYRLDANALQYALDIIKLYEWLAENQPKLVETAQKHVNGNGETGTLAFREAIKAAEERVKEQQQ